MSHLIDREKVSKIAEILSEISEKIWDEIVKREPEWVCMEKFYPELGFGKFTVLMIMLGLNDYQLKGKAEIVYWPLLRDLLMSSPLHFNDPKDLIPVLEKFFIDERLHSRKLKRLEVFLTSDLARELWNSNPEYIANQLETIMERLAKTMGQKKYAKTITFAMKCLGICLLIGGFRDFEYNVYIPVDYRIKNLTKRLTCNIEDFEGTLKFWQEVLNRIREKVNINMIHLDSLLWQIGTLSDKEIVEYFNFLGVREVGIKLSSILKNCV